MERLIQIHEKKRIQQLDLVSTPNFLAAENLEDENLGRLLVYIVANFLGAENHESLEENCHILDSWLDAQMGENCGN
jgi:hypothetical protein